jgi:hypothetical protein
MRVSRVSCVAKIGGGIAVLDGPVHFGGKSGIPTHSLASVFRSGVLCVVGGVGSPRVCGGEDSGMVRLESSTTSEDS